MEKVIETAKKRFKLCEDAWSENMDAALDDIRFARLGEQWPENVKYQREQESRPCLTINRLPSFIRQVVNDARQNSPSIKVHPVDDNSDPETAEVINGLIRSIEANSNAEVAYDTALESAVTCGVGYFRIGVDYTADDVFDLDICIERIANPLSVYPDPHSVEVDASDWTYCFVIEELSKDEFKATYPNAEITDWEADMEDGWITEDTVRVAEYWERTEEDTEILLLNDGTVIHKDQFEKNIELFSERQIVKSRKTKTHKVVQRIMTGLEVLEKTEWPGRYIPIIPCYGDEIVVENKRYFQSLTRQAKDPQRNLNYWRTAATERVALSTKAPWIGPVGAFDTDIRKWETANTETHPFIEYDGPQPPQQTPPSMMDAGAIQEAINASDDLKSIIGLYDASLGARSNETSGKAILARQREGDTSTFHFIDNLSRAIRYAGRVILDLIPHVYSEPRVIRVLGQDDSQDDVRINQEFESGGVVRMHDLTAGKYDLVVKAGPSFTTKREEAANQMIELLRSFPQAAPYVGDLLAQNLDWPGAEEIAKRLKVLLPPEIQRLDKLDGIPPEAQAVVARAENQIKQLMDVIDQGKKLLEEKDQEIQAKEMALKDKQDELMLKNKDIEMKHDIALAKIKEDQRELIVDSSLKAIEMKLEAQQKEFEAALKEQSDAITSAMKSSPVMKTVEVQAPSGEVYEGIVGGGEIKIKSPGGDIYEGIISEEMQ